MDMEQDHALVPSVSITNLLAQRDAMVERLERVHALLVEAAEIGQVSGIVDDRKYRGFAKLVGEHTCGHHVIGLLTPDAIALAKRRIDNSAWDYLMSQSGLFTFMHGAARERWRDDIDKGRTAPLTMENIRATFLALHASRGDMLEQGVIACFKQLSYCYKTNRPQMFGKRIVKRVRSYGSICHQQVDQLEDLNRAFAVLDGQPEDDHRNGLYTRLYAAEKAPLGRRSQFTHDDKYMRFRVFGNGNAHVTFTRPDLVEQMNRIIAKHFPDALPAPRA